MVNGEWKIVLLYSPFAIRYSHPTAGRQRESPHPGSLLLGRLFPSHLPSWSSCLPLWLFAEWLERNYAEQSSGRLPETKREFQKCQFARDIRSGNNAYTPSHDKR